jgi:predicted transposase/invertase (TIGR01784 family)
MKIDKEPFIYDRSLRELFNDIPKTLIRLLVKQDIKEILDISFPKVSERKVDLLTRLEDNRLFHLEIQSINDKDMPIRMLQYALLIYEKYKEFPQQLVLYVGEKRLNTKSYIKDKKLEYNYEVRDIREFDCTELIRSDDIADNIIALLCDIKDVDRLFKKLNERLERFSSKKREDYLRKVFYLLRLRPELNKEYEKRQEEINMPFVIDIQSDPIYQRGEEKGIEKGIEKGKLKGKLEERRAIAISLLDILDDETISKKVDLDIKEVREIRRLNS